MPDEPTIDPRTVRQQYNQRAVIWEHQDPWHYYTHLRLCEAIAQFDRRLSLNGHSILNIGSAGNSYNLHSDKHFYLDIADALLPREGTSVAGSAERLPFASTSFDLVMCVGSVVNYCDAVPVCREAARVLKPGGWLILEFESSESGEYLGRSEFGAMVAFVTTTYLNQAERIWLYSPVYLRILLEAAGLKIVSDQGFHISTTLSFRLFNDIEKSMRYAKLDNLALLRRLLRRFACNRIFLAQKSR